MTASEQHCARCLRMHAGECPTDLDPAALDPVRQPGRDGDPRSLADLLADVSRIAVADLPPDPRALKPDADPTPCELCHASRVWRHLERVDGSGMSPTRKYHWESICGLCARLESVPTGLRWARFDASLLSERVKVPQAISAARQATTHPFVVLFGNARQGKTTLMAAMFRARAEHGRTNLWMAARDLGLARSQWKLGEGESPVVLRAIAAPLLAIDDLGQERDLPTSAVGDVICARHEQHRATWVTTYMDREKVALRYGDGVAGRLFEAPARVIPVDADALAKSKFSRR